MKHIWAYFLFIIIAACNTNNDKSTFFKTGSDLEPQALSSDLVLSPSSFYIQTKINEKKSFSMYVQNQSNINESELISDLTSDNGGFNISVNECENKTLKPFESCRIEISVNSDKPLLNTTRLIIGNKKYTAQADLIYRSLPSTDDLVATNHFEHINQNSILRYNLKNSIASGEATNYTIVGDPNNGKIELNFSSGSFEYTPQSNFVGNDYFSFKAEDAYGNESNIAVFQIIVGKSEIAPIAYNQSITIIDNAPSTFSLLAQDPNNNKLKYTITKQPLKGKIQVNKDKYTYIPQKDSNGTDELKFKVNNGLHDSNVADVKITFLSSVESQNIEDDGEPDLKENLGTSIGMAEINHKDEPNKNNKGTTFTGTPFKPGLPVTRPIAPTVVAPTVPAVAPFTISSADMSLQMDEDSSTSVQLKASDSAAAFQIVSQPQNGTISGVQPNLIYTPNADYFGTDSFLYKSYKNGVYSNTAQVSIQVKNVNDIPEASDISFSVKFDESAQVYLSMKDMDNDELTTEILSSPSHGTLSGTYPNLMYTPNMQYMGSDSFTYKVDDGQASSETKTIQINVMDTTNNYAPVVNNQNATVTEDTPKNITLNATDVNKDNLTFTLVQAPQHGTVTFTNGQANYTPNLDYNGVDSFTYQANDGQLTSGIAQVDLTIFPVNDEPIASDKLVNLNEDEAANVDLTGSDLDLDTLNYIVITQPLHGTLSGTSPALVYTPNANYNGVDSFTYKINDGNIDSDIKSVNLTIFPVNDKPVANPNAYTTDENEPVSVVLAGSDIDTDPLTFTVVSQPLHGTISGSVPNLTYTPNANYAGADSFTFKVNDGTVDSDIQTITISINNLNFAPTANAIAQTTQEDVPVNLVLSGTDPDSDALTFLITNPPLHGTLSGTLPNLIYTPNLNYNGSDSFTYVVNDGNISSPGEMVSISVTPVNDAPIAFDQGVSLDEEEVKNITIVGTDVDGDSLTYTLISQPLHGTLSGSVPNLIYTPNANYTGTDSFTFKVNDGTIDSNVATVSLNISNLNDAPIANTISATTAEDTSANILLTGSDADSDTLSFIIVSAPLHGTLLGTPPNMTYVPNANYNGADSFTYKANDGTVDSNIVTVSITVTPVNDAPVSQNVVATTTEDVSTDIILNATDVDLDTLSYVVISQPLHGTLSGTLPNLTYTPNANYNGADSFTYKANDGIVDSNVSTVSITVSDINDAPVAVSQNISTNEDVAVNILLAATDLDNDPLTYVIVSQPAHGTLKGTLPNITYTPDLNYNGADSFTFKANDGSLDSNIATVSLTVTPVNDAPVANPLSFSTNEDVAYNGSLVATDVDGNTLTYSIIGTPTKGTVTIINLQTGAFVYTPNANYNGADSFSFMVNDGTLNSNIAMVSITVTPVNDAPVSANATFATNKNTTLNSNLTATDAENNALTYVVVSNPSNGTLTLNSNGTFAFVPNNNYFGAASFTYKVNDGTADSPTDTATITINNTNTAPVAQNLVVNVLSDSLPYSGQLIATDVDGDNLTYSVVSGSGISLNANGSFTYSTNSSTTFTFRANDGLLNSNTATVTINVTLRDNKFKFETNSSLINATISNFPLMIDLQNLNHLEHFWTNVQSNGGDILISLADQITKVPVAVRNFNKTARTGQIWFKANVTANTSTTFYLHYNNDSRQDIAMASASSTFGSNKVWENNYIGYWDMHYNGSSVSNGASSTLQMSKTSNPISLNHGHNDQAVELNTDGLKDDYFTAAYSSEAQLENEVTISAWVYPTKSVANSIILRKEGTAGKDNYSLRLDALKPYFTFDNDCGAKSITATQAIPLNRWTHLVGTFDRSTTTSKIYVNGTLVLEGSSTDHDHDSISATPVVIGRLNTSAIDQFEGYIDEVKLSANSVTSNWVQLEYNMTNQDNMFWLFDSETVAFSENFNRVNNNTVGNTWTEYEGCSGNANLSVYLLGLLGINITSANTSCGYMRIEHGALDFYSLDNSQAFPELTRSLTSINSGIVNLSFDVNFSRTGPENDYAFSINFGQSSKSIGELIWGSTNYGLSSTLGFGVVEKSLASVQQIKTMNHRETINVIINFTDKTYSVFAKGAGLENVSFEDPTAVLNKISFIVSNISSLNIPIVRIDNLIIKRKN